MSFQKGIELILEARTVQDGEWIGYRNDIFDTLDTNVDGLRELLRNVATAHIACSKECVKVLHKCNFNSGRIFLHREFPKSMCVDANTISGHIYVGDSNKVVVVLRKSLNLPYDNLITNFKIREGS